MLGQEQKITKSETRRGSKPLVEKKRRARINHSLAELQTLVLSHKKKSDCKQSRIEKADILEMTVHYLQRIQRQQKEAHSSSVSGKFRSGYLECVSEVSRYLTSIEKVDGSIHERLRAHLMDGLLDIQPEDDQKPKPAVEKDTSVYHVRIADADSRSSPIVTTTTPTPSPSPSLSQLSAGSISPGLPLMGVQVIPSRLPSGQLAFVLPTKDYLHFITNYGGTSSRPLKMSPDTSALSPSYLPVFKREKEEPSPDILYQAMCPAGGRNGLPADQGNVWRPW